MISPSSQRWWPGTHWRNGWRHKEFHLKQKETNLPLLQQPSTLHKALLAIFMILLLNEVNPLDWPPPLGSWTAQKLSTCSGAKVSSFSRGFVWKRPSHQLSLSTSPPSGFEWLPRLLHTHLLPPAGGKWGRACECLITNETPPKTAEPIRNAGHTSFKQCPTPPGGDWLIFQEWLTGFWAGTPLPRGGEVTACRRFWGFQAILLGFGFGWPPRGQWLAQFFRVSLTMTDWFFREWKWPPPPRGWLKRGMDPAPMPPWGMMLSQRQGRSQKWRGNRMRFIISLFGQRRVAFSCFNFSCLFFLHFCISMLLKSKYCDFLCKEYFSITLRGRQLVVIPKYDLEWSIANWCFSNVNPDVKGCVIGSGVEQNLFHAHFPDKVSSYVVIFFRLSIFWRMNLFITLRFECEMQILDFSVFLLVNEV